MSILLSEETWLFFAYADNEKTEIAKTQEALQKSDVAVALFDFGKRCDHLFPQLKIRYNVDYNLNERECLLWKINNPRW